MIKLGEVLKELEALVPGLLLLAFVLGCGLLAQLGAEHPAAAAALAINSVN